MIDEADIASPTTWDIWERLGKVTISVGKRGGHRLTPVGINF